MTLHLSAEELVARHRAQQKAWRLAHPDKVCEYHRRHHARPEVKERRLQWQRDNKERINARRRELYRERHPLHTQDSGPDTSDTSTQPET